MLLTNTIRFVVILLLQVLVFTNVGISGYIYPAFYVYFILLLPFETAGWVMLISAFAMGIGVDLFTNSLGINAAASVFTAFVRPAVIRILRSTREYEPGIAPGIKDLGFRWFFMYATILVLMHHTVLFLVEAFTFDDFLQTLRRILASSAVVLGLALIAQLLFVKQDKK
jgi:rod shape-determining protein MreD